MYIERQISYLHSQVSLAAYELYKSGVRNNLRRGTVTQQLYYANVQFHEQKTSYTIHWQKVGQSTER